MSRQDVLLHIEFLLLIVSMVHSLGSQIEPAKASQVDRNSQIEPARASQVDRGSQIEPARSPRSPRSTRSTSQLDASGPPARKLVSAL